MDNQKIDEFKSLIRGKLVQREDEDYEEARKVYNAMIDKKPLMIAYCEDVADVIASVNFGRENKLLIAIRGGGHNGGGLGVCDDGLVIDLSGIKYTRVDPEAKTIRVGAGCTWKDVDHAAHAFGMATPNGTVSSTGVAGLTLGGGIGHLTRGYGLTIDNLLEADMVLADGSFVTVSEKSNKELFWAIGGGGGNFGVVTSFLYKLHPVSMVYGGPMLYELSQAKQVLQWYRDFIAKAPDNISGFFALLNVPPGPPFPEELHGKKMCGIIWAYTGPMEKAESVFKPIRDFLKPALDFAGPLPFPVLQGLFDPLLPPGLQWYWRADFLKELSDEAIAVNEKHASLMPEGLSTMHIYPINGAAWGVGKKDTPWGYRDSLFAQVIVGIDPDPANKDKITKWTKDYWDAIHPFSSGGAYVNFMMDDEGDERVRATYGDNYDKLKSVKKKYDPDNLFRVNQNIKP